MQQFYYQQVKLKYDKLYRRVSKAIQTGKFSSYSAAKKQTIYKRLQRYEHRLKHWGYAVAGATALFLSPMTVVGQTPSGSEFQVNTYTTNNQKESSIAIDSDGDFVVVWGSYGQDGSLHGVYAQRYDNTGATVGSEFQVNTHTTGEQIFSPVAMDSDGDFVVVWESNGQDGDDRGIYAQRYDNTGATIGSEFQVNTYTTGNQKTPSVAMDSDGDFVVVWESSGQDGDGYGVYGQRYDNMGATVGSEFLVNTYTTGNQETPSVAMDSNGDFVVAWMSYGQDGSFHGVYAQRYNNTGATVGSEFQVNTVTEYLQRNPSVAMDSDGDFVVTWENYSVLGSPTGYDIYAQQYDNMGATVGSEFLVNTYTTDRQDFPSVAMDSDGDFVFTWWSNGQDGSGYGVYGQRYGTFIVPVELTSLEARSQEKQIHLHWQTASEVNNEGFEIEHSTDSRNWRNAGYVHGAGQSQALQSYEFIHDSPVVGINYYRLKQIDFDGVFEYSDIVSGTILGFGNPKQMSVSPNPVRTGSFNLTFSNPDFESGELSIYDSMGQLIQSQTIMNNHTEIQTNDFPKGIYMVSLEVSGQRFMERIVVQ